MARSDAPAEDDRPIEDALATARPEEPPGLVLAQARIANQLFGAAASGLGRFRVLERIGGGGMGVVYAAYDPDLDRGVALKTVHVPVRGQELAIREAKALAKLSHPNVVPVFDVGSEGGTVYIVMELVRGTKLGDWVAGKELRAILDVFRQAGLALAAAHHAGLVHRDFKPDNAIVGHDGRVRVVDFGLACEAEVAAGAAGTPQYMAPEQAAGAPITPRADQYSFCVALAEAVPEPMPRWIADVVTRGTATEPAARFASMPELLRALGRDPARVRRRRVLAATMLAGLAAVAVGAFSIGRGASAPEVEPCSGAEGELATAWPAEVQRAQLARVATLSAYGRELAPRLDQQLADQRVRWVATHRDACLVHLRGLQSDGLFDRRMACLDRSRTALATFVESVAAANADALPAIARSARELPEPLACADAEALSADVELPSPAAVGPVAAIRRELERARAQDYAGRFVDARTTAAAQVAAARRLGYAPVLAEALLVEGRARMSIEDPAAVARLAEATRIGFASGANAIAIEAWARRAWFDGMGDDPTAAIAGQDVVTALAGRSRSPFARALLANNLGSVELARGNRAAAHAAFERALAEARTVTGPGAVELVAIRTNMALVTDDAAERDRLFVAAHAELERLLGRDHPDTLLAQFTHATATVTSLPRAAAMLAETCNGHELHAGLTDRAAACWVEAADVGAELGDRDGALAALDRALAHGAATLPYTPEVTGTVRLWRGDPQGAIALLEPALRALAARPDETWSRAYTRAKLQLALGRAWLAAGRPAAARDVLVPAAATLAAITHDYPVVVHERRLARARAELARALAATHGDPSVPARQALDWLRVADAPATELAALGELTGSPR